MCVYHPEAGIEPGLELLVVIEGRWRTQELGKFKVSGRMFSCTTRKGTFELPVLFVSSVNLVRLRDGEKQFSYLVDVLANVCFILPVQTH